MSTLPANQEMASITADMPNVDAAAGLPEKKSISAKQIAAFINENYDLGLGRRRSHAADWLRVMSIMRNIHHFRIRNGRWQPLRKKEGEIRAVRKIMKPRFRWELGRLNSNQVGVSVSPKIGHGENAYLWAERASAIMPDWAEEEDLQGFFDESNQYLLYYGMTGYHRYVDWFHRRARLEAVPGPELFPVPYDVPSIGRADGLMRVNLVSKQWLEMQDAATAQRLGHEDFPHMARKAGSQTTSLFTDFSGIASVDNFGGKMDGAVVKNVWMKISESYPNGAWFFLVEDELFRAKVRPDEQGTPLFNNQIPMELVYYTKRPDDFWGDGFCQDMISEQLEANRQLTDIVINARKNRPFTVFDSELIDMKDIQGEIGGWIPARGGAFETQKPPLLHVPAAQLSRDVGAILGIVEQGADKAVGYESGIITGRQEGRTEGGPATNLLNDNARQPLQPVTDRIFRAFKRTFPHILDMNRLVWPEEKLVKAPGQFGREMLIKRDDVPSSDRVVMTPNPIVPGGNNTILQLLFQLRSMPSDDGKGFEVTSAEMRRSLRLMNLNPPGLELIDEVEQRINVRIGLLINDGQRPAIQPASPANAKELVFEDHQKAVDLFKKAILDPGAKFYSPQVMNALLEELGFHGGLVTKGFSHPDSFDDDVDDEDARFSERVLNSDEQDLGSFESSMTDGGVPVGLAI